MKTDRTKSAGDHKIRCAGCSKITPGHEIINYGSIERGYRQLCSHCFNELVAQLDGIEGFENVKFEPVGLADCTGEIHEFHFRTRLFGPGVSVDAFELRDGSPTGYQFQIIGDPENDQLVLFGRLIERIRRALSVKHIVSGELGPQIADHCTVRGRVAWDAAHEGRLPSLVIDGREIAWEDFGRMMMTYEGWHFKLHLHDKSEEV